MGRPRSGVGILFKKFLGNKIKPIIFFLNRRTCGIIFNITSNVHV